MGNDTFAGVPWSVGSHGPEEGLTGLEVFRVGYDSDQVRSHKTIAINFCQRLSLPIIIIVGTSDMPSDTGAKAFANQGTSTRIEISPSGTNLSDNDNDRLLYLTMMEVSKIFMYVQDTGWYAGFLDEDTLGLDAAAGNIGEGLSHYCAAEFAKIKLLNFVDDFANQWMTTPASTTAPARDLSGITASLEVADGGPQSACALLFIYFLHAQLGFSTEAIIANGDKNAADENTVAKLSLADVYRSLTQDTSGEDGTALFSKLLTKYFPFPSAISGPSPQNLNNPWPLVDIQFFGSQFVINVVDVYEIEDNVPGFFTNSVDILFDGLTISTLGHVDITITCPAIPGCTFRIGRGPTQVSFQENVPQTFVRVYDLNFPGLGVFLGPGISFTVEFVATVTFTPDFPFLPSSGVPSVQPIPATRTIALAGSDANPIFQNVATRPAGTNPWFLSQDLVVLTVTPRHNAAPVQPGMNEAPPALTPQFHIDPTTSNLEADDSAFALQYLKDLLGWLNTYYVNGGSGFGDPFEKGVIPQSPEEMFSNPSVLTNWTYWNDTSSNTQRRARAYHFGLARVRLNDVGGANNQNARAPRTEVFFRHFDGSTDTTFNAATTYLTTRMSGNPPFPASSSTNGLPIFGTNVTPTQLAMGGGPEFKPGGLNTRDLVRGQTQSTWAYYGCFIDSIRPSLPPRGSYQWTLVAQIDYPPVAFAPADFSPVTSTKLAQRDISFIDN